MIKILLLEDDQLFAETLIDLLEDNDFEVSHAPNGQDALDTTFENKFDIYILDINVPIVDGVTLLTELRGADDSTPAIFLTSHKEKEMLQKAFLSGADDFLTKPFDNDELLLRIQAIINRMQPKKRQCIKLLCHDEIHKRILYDDTELELSPKEYDLLVLLMKHVDAPVPKEMIMQELWATHEDASEGAIRVYINKIKQLLPQVVIENIRGIGYRLVS